MQFEKSQTYGTREGQPNSLAGIRGGGTGTGTMFGVMGPQTTTSFKTHTDLSPMYLTESHEDRKIKALPRPPIDQELLNRQDTSGFRVEKEKDFEGAEGTFGQRIPKRERESPIEERPFTRGVNVRTRVGVGYPVRSYSGMPGSKVSTYAQPKNPSLDNPVSSIRSRIHTYTPSAGSNTYGSTLTTDLKSSQAIAGAMKALQEKCRVQSEDNQMLNQKVERAREDLDVIDREFRDEKKRWEAKLLLEISEANERERRYGLATDKLQKEVLILKGQLDRSDDRSKQLKSQNDLLKQEIELQTQNVRKTTKDWETERADILNNLTVEGDKVQELESILRESEEAFRTMKTENEKLHIVLRAEKSNHDDGRMQLEKQINEITRALKVSESNYDYFRQGSETKERKLERELNSVREALKLTEERFALRLKEVSSEKVGLEGRIQTQVDEMDYLKRQVTSLQKSLQELELARNSSQKFVEDVVIVNEQLVNSLKDRNKRKKIYNDNLPPSARGHNRKHHMRKEERAAEVLADSPAHIRSNYREPPPDFPVNYKSTLPFNQQSSSRNKTNSQDFIHHTYTAGQSPKIEGRLNASLETLPRHYQRDERITDRNAMYIEDASYTARVRLAKQERLLDLKDKVRILEKEVQAYNHNYRSLIEKSRDPNMKYKEMVGIRSEIKDVSRHVRDKSEQLYNFKKSLHELLQEP